MANPKIPQPVIYLRNKFAVRPGLTGRFFEGQRALLNHTRRELPDSARQSPSAISLIAAGAEAPLMLDAPVPEQLPRCMHLWRLPEWSTLYQLMYTFTESDWYADEVSSLQIEHQDLLIGIGNGIALEQRPVRWKGRTTPGYLYLYDEIRLNIETTKFEYLRHLNWFASQVAPRHWKLTWIAAEVTGTPSQVCILWQVPSTSAIETTLQFMAYDPSMSERYAEMMASIQSISRRYLHPESTEEIDNELNPRKEP